MGLSPEEVDRLSVWQYLAALAGYISANSVDEDKKLSESEKDELWDWIKPDGGFNGTTRPSNLSRH